MLSSRTSDGSARSEGHGEGEVIPSHDAAKTRASYVVLPPTRSNLQHQQSAPRRVVHVAFRNVSINPVSLFASIMPKLPCIVFLERHLKHGGVNESGFKALKSVIGMISKMGWETHVIFEGKLATGVSMSRMEEHMARILQVCKIFKKNMKDGLVKVEYAANGLPDLKDEKGNRLDHDELDDALTTWENKLR